MGNFVHIELNSTDHEKAKAFYTKVFGWKTMDMPMTGGSYTMVDGMMNPGIGMASAQEGMPSAWTAYIDVDDVKKTVAKATKAGAQAVVPYMPVQGPDGSVMGEIAILADPTGAMFGIWHGVAQPEGAAAEAPAAEAAPAPATKKKATKKKAAKKKAAKKKAAKKKAAKKKPAKKAAKKKATKKNAAKKKPAKKAAKKKTKKKASRKKKA